MVRKLFKSNFADFWLTEIWPSSNPYMNSQDYVLSFGILEQATNMASHNILKSVIKEDWAKTSWNVVDNN